MLKVVFIAGGGFPTKDKPFQGVFNKRAATQLANLVKLTVVQYRIYLPGRKFMMHEMEEHYNKITLCVPIIPFFSVALYSINNFLFRQFTNFYIKDYLKTADVVHCVDGDRGVLFSGLKKKFTFKLLVQFIGGDLNQDLPQQLARGRLNGWTKDLDAVSFNSKSLEALYTKLFGVHKIMQVIYRGVNAKVFFPKSNPKYKNMTTVFYFLGGVPNYKTFSEGRNTKGGLTLMDAWSIIDEKFRNDKIALKFAGPDSDIEFVEKWKCGLINPNRVELIGMINPEDIPSFHQQGDVMVAPSLEEGLPNTVMEACATEKLVIATNIGGIPEIIENNVTGLLIDPDNPIQLSNTISRIILNKKEVERYGRAARIKMGLEFDNRKFGEAYVNLYNHMLKV